VKTGTETQNFRILEFTPFTFKGKLTSQSTYKNAEINACKKTS